MSVRRKSFAIAAATVAALTSAAVAQPAAATAQSDPEYFVSLYTGPDLTGTETPISLEITGECVNLSQPVKSGIDIAPVNLEIYFNADCVKGFPGQPGDIYFILGSLHAGNFPFPAMSYRVVPMID
ncbi:hypothetical protein [Kibdelosporangium aridum]|uniref:Secreted protein n=1 Tax=Kibdelosporangium aridum TaxID=2030 RepID=A0A1Y5Y685_KIBAR|nr:hypothetical protein [Kibdelosporangium aridum]SMD26348.1 hypothetical protein SAMN05661093_09931 [Kibdelosporangium aridum]